MACSVISTQHTSFQGIHASVRIARRHLSSHCCASNVKKKLAVELKFFIFEYRFYDVADVLYVVFGKDAGT